MPNYETVYIVKPEITDDKASELLEKLKGLIVSNDGNVLLTDNWGRKRLAYSIGKNKEGNYFLIQFSSPPSVTEELREFFSINDSIIRHLIVKMQKPAKKKRSGKKEQASAESQPVAASPVPSDIQSSTVPSMPNIQDKG